MSTMTDVERLPRLPHTGRVTQVRVVLSEWTKLHSLRTVQCAVSKRCCSENSHTPRIDATTMIGRWTSST